MGLTVVQLAQNKAAPTRRRGSNFFMSLVDDFNEEPPILFNMIGMSAVKVGFLTSATA
jgi:hypothetical protein